MSRFRFVDDHRDTFTVKRLCWLAGVSRSGYYAWKARPVSARTHRDVELLTVIAGIHEESHGTYGRPRICGQLHRQGLRVNHKRVARLMRDAGIAGLSNRKPRHRDNNEGDRAQSQVPGEDLVGRDFTATAPNTRWVADITEFNTGQGRLYLAGILDLYSRRCVGWAMGPRRDAELVVDALVMAIGRRRPDPGVIHHGDHGSQYTSTVFADAAADAHVALSFGRVGDAYDNAAMEAFWSTLKRELAHIHHQRHWTTRTQLKAALFNYIEVFYNRNRHQARLGHRTPTEYENDHEAA